MEAYIAIEEMIEMVAEMLAKGAKKSTIKKAIYEVNGGAKCSRGTVEKILRLARAMLVEASGLSHEENLGEAIEFYRAVIRDEDTTAKEKMEARKQLDNIFGLGAQFRTDTASRQESAAKAREAMKQMRERTESDGEG